MENEITMPATADYAKKDPTPVPKGIKITAILLIVLCGLQLIGWNTMLVVAADKLGTTLCDFVIYSTMIFGSLTPFLGLAAGIGVLMMKRWGRTLALVFSVIAVLLYGAAFSLALYGDETWRQSVHVIIFPVGFLIGLPLWTLIYLSRKKVRMLFTRPKNN